MVHSHNAHNPLFRAINKREKELLTVCIKLAYNGLDDGCFWRHMTTSHRHVVAGCSFSVFKQKGKNERVRVE